LLFKGLHPAKTDLWYAPITARQFSPIHFIFSVPLPPLTHVGLDWPGGPAAWPGFGNEPDLFFQN